MHAVSRTVHCGTMHSMTVAEFSKLLKFFSSLQSLCQQWQVKNLYSKKTLCSAVIKSKRCSCEGAHAPFKVGEPSLVLVILFLFEWTDSRTLELYNFYLKEFKL